MTSITAVISLLVLLSSVSLAQQQQHVTRPVYTPLPPGSINPDTAVAAFLAGSQTTTSRAAAPEHEASTRRTQSKPPSSSSSNLCSAQSASSGPWGLTAIQAHSSGLPTKSEQVLVCIISSGVATNIQALKHNRWAGCTAQDPLDPGGCVLNWSSPEDNKGFWKPRGTFLASIIAARKSANTDSHIQGVVPDGADIYVVPVNTATGSLESAKTAKGGNSRIRAYSACEGRLRGLQAQDYGVFAPPVRWRMVMLADVADTNPTQTLGSREYKITEADWFSAATGTPVDSNVPDVLVIAPAGDANSGISFPASFPQVLSVAGYNCEGAPMYNYTKNALPGAAKVQPDILAPGIRIPVPDVRKDGVNGVKDWEGNAAAAAYVAGAAVRLWNKYPKCGAPVIRQALLSTRPGGGGGPAMLNLLQAAKHLETIKC